MKRPVFCRFGTVVAAGLLALAVRAAERPQLVVGLLSDVHMDENNPATQTNFVKALRFFDRKKVDAVFCCGDMVELGWWQWYKMVGRYWFEVFPDSRRSDGALIEKCFIFGDHEVENFYNPNITRRFSDDYIRERDIPAYGRGKIYEEVLKEPWAPIIKKTVKGFDVVMAMTTFSSREGEVRSKDCWYCQNIPHLKEFFSTNDFNYAKPFFYLQHKPIYDTIIAKEVSGHTEEKDRLILNDHPNCVAFCGHKHRSATAEHSLWQGEFTCVAVPSLQTVQTDAGHENGWASCDGYSPSGQQMPVMKTFPDGGQGLVMCVYRDRIVFERWNLRFEEKVADDWVVPWPVKKSCPASFDARAAKSRPPAFPKGAKITVTSGVGRDRAGRETDQYTVHFPAAHSAPGVARGYDYKVTVGIRKQHWTRIASEKFVFSPKAYLPERRDTNETTCVFSTHEVPTNHDAIRIKVTPYNAFQVPGEPLLTDWMKVPFKK